MRRTLLAVALASSLLAMPAGQSGLLDPLWSFLVSLWSQSSSDAGCGMDPDGCAESSQPQTDIGCGADPNGCAEPQIDAGCGWDPDGRQCS